MTQESAQTILYAITAAAAVVWLGGLAFLVSTGRSEARPPEPDSRYGAEPRDPRWIEGAAEVRGERSALIDGALSTLAGGAVPGVGSVRILDETQDEIIFEGLGLTSQQHGRLFSVGRLRFLPGRSQETTRVEYALRMRGRGLLAVGAAVQCLGLLAIVAGFILIATFVVPSEHLNVRGQVWQMAQVAHFLWPPFLFAGLYRMQRRMLRTRFEALVGNLAFLRR